LREKESRPLCTNKGITSLGYAWETRWGYGEFVRRKK